MNLKLGSHVSMSGKSMLLGSAKEAESYGANTFMFYTGAPQNTKRKDISELNIDAAWNYMNEKNISIEQLEMEKMSIHYMNQNYLIKMMLYYLHH